MATRQVDNPSDGVRRQAMASEANGAGEHVDDIAGFLAYPRLAEEC